LLIGVIKSQQGSGPLRHHESEGNSSDATYEEGSKTGRADFLSKFLSPEEYFVLGLSLVREKR